VAENFADGTNSAPVTELRANEARVIDRRNSDDRRDSDWMVRSLAQNLGDGTGSVLVTELCANETLNPLPATFARNADNASYVKLLLLNPIWETRCNPPLATRSQI
jgi:hypothetical protein